MKNALSMIVVMSALGCAGAPGPAGDLAQACIAERGAVLLNEWARFESVSRQRVFIPDWRTRARRWARVECDRGRPVGAFHPMDTATARRYY